MKLRVAKKVMGRADGFRYRDDTYNRAHKRVTKRAKLSDDGFYLIRAMQEGLWKRHVW